MKDVGVIPEPEVKEFTIGTNDKFMIMASDGVWEFITSQVLLMSKRKGRVRKLIKEEKVYRFVVFVILKNRRQ